MSKSIGPVTTGAATGTGAGGAFAIVLVWVLSQFGVNMPDEVAMGVAALVSIVGSLVGGYLVRPGGEHVA